MAKKKPAPIPRFHPPQRIVANPVRVLVVDDDDARRVYVAKFLQDEGFDVRDANGIDTALEQVDDNWAEVMVLDMQMPNPAGDPSAAGLVVLRALDGRHERPGVVVFSDDPISPTTQAARELGAVAVMDRAANLEKLAVTESLGWQVCAAWHWRHRLRAARTGA